MAGNQQSQKRLDDPSWETHGWSLAHGCHRTPKTERQLRWWARRSKWPDGMLERVMIWLELHGKVKYSATVGRWLFHRSWPPRHPETLTSPSEAAQRAFKRCRKAAQRATPADEALAWANRSAWIVGCILEQREAVRPKKHDEFANCLAWLENRGILVWRSKYWALSDEGNLDESHRAHKAVPGPRSSAGACCSLTFGLPG